MLLLGPAWGLLTNVALFLPFTIFVARGSSYSGHAQEHARTASSFGFADAWASFLRARSEPQILTMVVLAGASSFFVGNAFQAQMPEYAHFLGADDTGARYSILLAAHAAGAVIGVVLLESATLIQPSVRATIVVCGAVGAVDGTVSDDRQLSARGDAAGAWPASSALPSPRWRRRWCRFSRPPAIRGTIVGLFNTAMLGLRAGSGFTVGVLGAFIGVRLSLELSSLMVILIALVLLARQPAGRNPLPSECTRSG